MNVVKVKESEAIGNSILAGYGVGIHKDMVSAAKKVIKIERVVEPPQGICGKVCRSLRCL